MTAVRPPISPMLAKLVRELPTGDWLFEPKWDGFRCLLFVDDEEVYLQSRNERPLARYFPEVVDAAGALPRGVVLDGELLVRRGQDYDFPALLERIHPAASRVETLAVSTPATFTAFDCLAVGRSLMTQPLAERRQRLETVFMSAASPLQLTPATADPDTARRWLDEPTGGWDGIVAKSPAAAYQPGRRVMLKVKHDRTADCVVAGVRLNAGGVASVLLGLWQPDGVLHHPGVITSPPAAVKQQLGAELRSLVVPLEQHPWVRGFGLEGGATGRLKGAGSRWVPGMTQDWVPVAPRLVAEVAYDRLDGLRFRHPAKFRRWRPDRDAATCLVDQLVTGR